MRRIAGRFASRKRDSRKTIRLMSPGWTPLLFRAKLASSISSNY